MKTFLLVLALLVVVALVVQRRRIQTPDLAGSSRSLLQTVDRAVRGGMGGLVPRQLSDDVLVLENNVISAVFATGVRTRRTRSLLFGNAVTVSISEDGERALRPVRAIVEDEIIAEIVERADAEGFTLAGQPRLQFVVDRSMSGFDARVRTAVDKSTPVTSAGTSRQPDRPRGTDLPITLRWLSAVGSQFVVPADGSEQVVGRSSSADWQIDSPLVSSRHMLVSVVVTDGHAALRVMDLDSTNKTTIDGGRPITPRKVFEAGHGALLGLGPHVRIRVLQGTSVDEDTAPTHGPESQYQRPRISVSARRLN